MRKLGFWMALLMAAPASAAKPQRLVACVPDAPGSTRAAAPFLKRFFRVLEGALGWEAGRVTGLFTPSKKRCLRELRRPKTTLGLLSMDLYLPWRKRFRLRPLAVTEVGGAATTRYHVVVRKGAVKRLRDLAGARFFTNHANDRRLLARVVLDGKLGHTVPVRRTPRPLQALRAVRSGDERATLLDDGELEKMKALPFGEELEVLHSSGPIPNPVVVAIGKRSGRDGEALAAKMLTLCQGEAKASCENLRLSGFRKPDMALLDKVVESYGR